MGISGNCAPFNHPLFLLLSGFAALCKYLTVQMFQSIHNHWPFSRWKVKRTRTVATKVFPHVAATCGLFNNLNMDWIKSLWEQWCRSFDRLSVVTGDGNVSAPSCRPISHRFDLRCWFLRWSSSRVSSCALFWRDVSGKRGNVVFNVANAGHG